MKALVLILVITCLSLANVYSLDSTNDITATMINNDTLNIVYVLVANIDTVIEGGIYILIDNYFVYNDSLTIIQANKIALLRKELL